MKLITLIIFLNIGLFKVNSCDCCNENKSSGSGSSSQKPPKQIDISGRTIEELNISSLCNNKIDVCSGIDSFDLKAFSDFLKNPVENLYDVLKSYKSSGKIKIGAIYKRLGSSTYTDVIIFVSSDVVSSLGLDTNNNKLHRLNSQIYYFYYSSFESNDITIENNNITIENKDNAFAKLDIFKLRWTD